MKKDDLPFRIVFWVFVAFSVAWNWHPQKIHNKRQGFTNSATGRSWMPSEFCPFSPTSILLPDGSHLIINCLLYADDLLLVSMYRTCGTQNSSLKIVNPSFIQITIRSYIFLNDRSQQKVILHYSPLSATPISNVNQKRITLMRY